MKSFQRLWLILKLVGHLSFFSKRGSQLKKKNLSMVHWKIMQPPRWISAMMFFIVTVQRSRVDRGLGYSDWHKKDSKHAEEVQSYVVTKLDCGQAMSCLSFTPRGTSIFRIKPHSSASTSLLSVRVRASVLFKHSFPIFIAELQSNKEAHWIIRHSQDKNSAE